MSKTHNLKQSSDEWLAFRKTHFGASEAAAMLGVSQYKSRDALLREKATGITPEVNEATQRLFDEGHRMESEARPIAEKIIGEDLFSPTMSKVVDGLNLSASFDGVTMMDGIAWECKTMNAKLKEALPDSIPESYHPQLEQQLLISGAEKVMFMAYDGTDELHCWYESNPELRKRIIAGWKQFAKDMKNYKAPEVSVEVVAQSVESLPALNVQISGGVTKSNLEQYKTTALKFIAGINTELQTDQDFADADSMVKFCGKTEKELDAVKTAALNQTADIADLFSTIDTLKAEMRGKRLMLDKLVKSRKQQVKEEIVQGARREFAAHCNKLDGRLHDAVRMPDIAENFAGVIKNKRTIASLQNAVNTELAHCKIEANELADHIEANVKKLLELSDDKYAFLFPDIQEIVLKPEDDMVNLAVRRISEHEKAEQAKLEAERERIRAEEQAKAAAEQRRIAYEEQRKAEEQLKLERLEHDRKMTELSEQAMDAKAEEESTPVDELIYKEPEPVDINDYQKAKDEKAQRKGFGELDDLEFCSMDGETNFDIWWRVEGSRIRPDQGEDAEEFARRIAGIAWCVARIKDTG